jgi:hypothetical protein
MLLQKFWHCKASPPRFLSNADKEKHEQERLKKGKGMGPKRRNQFRAKKHRDPQGSHGHRYR